MRPQCSAVRRIARIATRSHGVVTRAELLLAGITPAEIKHRVATGALLRQHRGVYRVGHRAPSVEARYLARHAWEQDREREREAHRRGDAFRRYTYDDVAAARTLEELRTLMESPQLSRAVGRSP